MQPREVIGTVIAVALIVFVLVLASSLFFGTPPGASANTVFDKMIGLIGPIVGFYFGSAPTAAAQEAAADAKSELKTFRSQSAKALDEAGDALGKAAHTSADTNITNALALVKELRARID